MEQDIFQTRFDEFITPSGHRVKIREQNGADDDILSNPAEATTLKNLSRFIAGIIMDSDYTNSGKLTVDEVHNLPSLDRYAILIHSRIFSLGPTMEFKYNWGENGGEVEYEQDLNELIFDYSQTPTMEELEAKPNAVPFYPEPEKIKDIEFTLTSGKQLKFDLMTANGESYVANLPLDKQTKNQIYVARNLCYMVNEKWDKVSNFALFSVKDMIEIRNHIHSLDPIFNGTTIIENPVTHEKLEVPIVGMKDFFYPGEI